MDNYNLGVVPIFAAPAIAKAIIAFMVSQRISGYQAACMAAVQFEAFQDASEAQITELALYLGRETDIPYWEWFNVLRTAQKYSFFEPPPYYPNGNHEPPPDEDQGVPTWTWVLLAAVGVVFLLELTR